MLKWYPFIYLEAWKVYPFHQHVCIYLYNGNYPPPRDCQHHHRIQGWFVSRVSYTLPPPPLPRHGCALYTGKSEGMGLAVQRYLCLFCRTARSTFSRVGCPLPGGKVHVHTQDSSYPRTLWTPQTNLDVIGLRSVAFVPVSMYLKWYTFIKTVNAKSVASLDVTR